MNGYTSMMKRPSHDVAGFDQVPNRHMQAMQKNGHFRAASIFG